MKSLLLVAVCAASLASAAVVPKSAARLHDPPAKPDWPKQYSVSGRILLPYAEINEPFSAWFDRPNNRSRIDYYNGMVITLQRGDLLQFGEMKKFAPMALDDGVVQSVCFGVNGTDDGRVGPQNVLPDLTMFSYMDTRNCTNGVDGSCEAWGYTDYPAGNTKVDYFLLLVKRNGDGSVAPVMYEMQGYDTLFGSHYDRYVIYYEQFNNGAPNADIFDPNSSMQCGGFPGPGERKAPLSLATMNPMRAYIDNDHSHVHTAFDEFKTKHGRAYANDAEHHQRRRHFLNNYRYIESMNRKGLSYSLTVNHFADRSEDDLRALRGRRPVKDGKLPTKGIKFDTIVGDRPETWDWRILGAVTPVKDQAICGSCWSFGTVGAIEGAYFVQSGNLTDLSEQSLIDCSWEHGNDGCDGGEEWRAYEWMMGHNGIMTESDYGQYLGEDGRCHHDQSKTTVRFANYLNISSSSGTPDGIAVLESAVMQYGPVAINIDADHKSFLFYDKGVFSDPQCKSDDDDLDHSVLLVGFGLHPTSGKRYWLVKNSWSTYWGNDGYVLMGQDPDDCGVTTNPTTPMNFY